MSNTLRVAAAQFATGVDVEENLATVLRMIDEAADAVSPDVLVLPEFCNHLSIYDDGQHAWDVAVTLDGRWVAAVGAAAARHEMWIQCNVTVQRSGESASREPAPGRITNTNLLFDVRGALVAANDKTVLMGAEGDFLSAAESPAELVDVGDSGVTIGTYACMDGVIAEVPRGLVVRGANLLLNSLNSFALDEASLHIPVRAAENRTWVVSCCKVGPLLPPEKMEMMSAAIGIPASFLHGAGESQIIAPDGTVVSQARREGEAIIHADIDVADDTRAVRPDGTDLLAQRRPEVYRALAMPTPPHDRHPRAEAIDVTVVSTIEELAGALDGGAALVVAPAGSLDDREDSWVSATVAEHGIDGALVVGTRRVDDAHIGVAIDATGVVLTQQQIHRSPRWSWHTDLGDTVEVLDTAWGRVAVIVGDDALYPEVARLAALASCDVIAVPFTPQEPWEMTLGLVERAAENRMCCVASGGRSGDPAFAESGTGLIVTLPPDFTLWAPSRERVFGGTINRPDVIVAPSSDGRATGVVHPGRTVNRQISKGTNLVDGRPWRLAGALTDASSLSQQR